MGGGYWCPGGANPRFEAVIEGAQGAVAAGHGSGGLKEGLAGTVVALAGGGADDRAAGDLVVRAGRRWSGFRPEPVPGRGM